MAEQAPNLDRLLYTAPMCGDLHLRPSGAHAFAIRVGDRGAPITCGVDQLAALKRLIADAEAELAFEARRPSDRQYPHTVRLRQEVR